MFKLKYQFFLSIYEIFVVFFLLLFLLIIYDELTEWKRQCANDIYMKAAIKIGFCD